MGKTGPKARSPADRMWPRVDARGPFECWLWTGPVNNKGYAVVSESPGDGSSIRILVHRIAYADAYGEIPEGLNVLHHCDRPRCVNPLHLFAGTQAANVADMDNKGRRRGWNPAGMMNPAAKLTADNVVEIRSLLATTSNAALGRQFGVSNVAIRFIRIGRTWKEVA